MKDLVWDHVLSVGVDEVDDDHRKLVDLFNMLNHSLTEGDAPEYLAAVLEELINCTAWHFSHEERLMLKYGYEGIAEHKEEHQELIKSAKTTGSPTTSPGWRLIWAMEPATSLPASQIWGPR